ncbi:MAG: ABC transporter permease [Gemmatimonadetes bacterium]|nr:ABC transporter permease [Gemmatimonadota bacterium]
MDTIFSDIRYAVRGLIKNPSVSIVAVVALALGIGFTTVMFSIVYGALYRGLPFEGAEAIMHLERANPTQGIESMEVTIHDYRDWQERQRSFTHLAAFYQGTVNIRGTERPDRYDGGFMTANSFEVIGVQPILGRGFREEDEQPGSPQVALLGYRVWQERYGGSPDVLGQGVTINGELGQIIGVMPEGFEFPVLEEVWVPLRLDHVALERGAGQSVEVFGDIKEDVSLDQAMTEFAGIAAQLASEYPETNEGVTANIKPYTEEYIGDAERGILLSMLFTVVMVLIIACANVANLLLARASGRSRDLAIQTAMGASRARVMSQMIMEAGVLAAVGAALGTGVAWIGISMFDRAISSTDPPFWLDFTLDGPILLFVVAIAGLSALVAGGIPALKASGADVNSVLKDESRGSSGMRIGRITRVLVIGEIAMSMALLVASGLMVKGVVKLNNEDYGFPTENVFTARVGVFPERFPDEASRLRFWEDVEQRVAQLPGVLAAGMTSNLPGTGSNGSRFTIDGVSYEADRDLPTARFAAVTPGFAETFEFEALQGRWLESTDNAEAPQIAVINQSFVDRYFPDGQAIGRSIRFGGVESDDPWKEIVGVVPNHRMEGLGNPGETEVNAPGFYIPLAQYDLRFVSIAARVDSDPLLLSSPVRDAVAAADADTPIYFVETLDASLAKNMWFYRIFGNLFMAFGLAALFMASVGLYGVMSFSVSSRVSEMGVRMALGAQASQVTGLIIKQGLGQIAVGLLIGSGLAVLVARGLTLLLYQVEPWDPATFAIVLVLLLTTGVGACAIPAMRATRVDPMTALSGD